MLNKIFSSLKSLGFNNVDNVELYSKEEKEKKSKLKEDKKTEIDIRTLLYDKKVKCPVCKQEFSARVVKTSAGRVKSRDSDTCINYEVINPMLYDVWVCPTCGYAALKGEFPKIRSFQINDVLMKISNQWLGKEYPDIYDENIAIERYKLALLNAVALKSKDSTKAILCLRIAWIYRSLKNEELEKEFLKKALEGFLLAYEKEDTPIYGLDTYSLIYMIGELYRRTGDYHNAILWLGKVITGPGAGPKIKDKARDMRDLAREMEIESVKLQA